MTGDDARRDRIAASTVLLTAEVSKLNARLEDVVTSVDEQAEGTRALNQRARTHSFWIFGTIVGLVLSLVACVAFGFLLHRFYEERRVVHCPFYSLIVGSYNPQSRPEGPARQKYEEDFQRMREIHAFLNCGSPTPPAIRAPAPPR